ncbi:MAG: GTPase domain-containing protein [Planctomycetaceae bacterium]
MSHAEIARLEMLAEVDGLTADVRQWSERESHWEPINRCAGLLRRVLGRVESLRVRHEAPLVVATFGGTGTGKSSLVNALVGDDVALSGRQRPTTRRPVLIAHSETDLGLLELPQDLCDVERNDSSLLRDTVIIDCPDPDTTDTGEANSNLERLRKILPFCDVLIYTSTQQKYRSARVVDELAEAATGCRLVFVQTHADLDEDIREDWREHLSGRYEVPDVFFVDSLRALEEQRQGHRPTGDMGRLLDFLSRQLASSERVTVRRANVVDLLDAGLERCVGIVDERWPKLEELNQALRAQHESLRQKMASNLQRELMVSRNLWERRLLTAVTATWGFSPFSSVLRLYNGLGALIASFTLFRARNSAQMALLGAIQGYRWLEGRSEEKVAEASLERAIALGLDDTLLRESQLIIAGHVGAASLDPSLTAPKNLREIRGQAVAVEQDFLGDAASGVDAVIDDLAIRNSGWFVRGLYELLFISYLAYVLFRIGKNFFYESFLDRDAILSTDFYIPATVFLVLWTGWLVIAFTHRLRRGLTRRIEGLSQDLVNRQMEETLFPELQQVCEESARDRLRLHQLHERSSQLRQTIATSTALGSAKRDSLVESKVVTVTGS